MSRHKKAGYPQILLLTGSTQRLNNSPLSLTTSFIGSFIFLILQAKKLAYFLTPFSQNLHVIHYLPLIALHSHFMQNPAVLHLHCNYSNPKIQQSLAVSLIRPLPPLVTSKRRKAVKMCQIMLLQLKTFGQLLISCRVKAKFIKIGYRPQMILVCCPSYTALCLIHCYSLSISLHSTILSSSLLGHIKHTESSGPQHFLFALPRIFFTHVVQLITPASLSLHINATFSLRLDLI